MHINAVCGNLHRQICVPVHCITLSNKKSSLLNIFHYNQPNLLVHKHRIIERISLAPKNWLLH